MSCKILETLQFARIRDLTGSPYKTAIIKGWNKIGIVKG